jgi:hypothetical protein
MTAGCLIWCVPAAIFSFAQADDERWENLLAAPERRPRLDAFLKASAAEGDVALDPSRL